MKAMDVDVWVNQRLIPWYLMGGQIKRKLSIPMDQMLNPKEFMKFIEMVMDRHAKLVALFLRLSQVFKQIISLDELQEAEKLLSQMAQKGRSS